MGSGFRKKKNIKSEWEYYNPGEKDYEALRFCIRNNIRISMVPTEQGMDPKNFKISVALGPYQRGEKVNLSPNIYSKEIIVQEMYKAMKYYYEKHNK
jgi:hypothetical protein